MICRAEHSDGLVVVQWLERLRQEDLQGPRVWEGQAQKQVAEVEGHMKRLREGID